MPSNKTPGPNTLLARRQLNDFLAVRLDLMSIGCRSLIRLGFEGRARGGTKWKPLNLHALLDLENLKWLCTELSRAEKISATLSKEEDRCGRR